MTDKSDLTFDDYLTGGSGKESGNDCATGSGAGSSKGGANGSGSGKGSGSGGGNSTRCSASALRAAATVTRDGARSLRV